MTNEDVGTNSVADRLQLGPREGVTYPIQMKYCGHCTMPIEVSSSSNLGKIHIRDHIWPIYLHIYISTIRSTASTIRSTRSARSG